MLSMAIACLTGGVLGAADLRFAYALTAGGAVGSLLVLRHIAESGTTQRDRPHFTSTVISSLGTLRDLLLAWLFVVMIMLHSLEGIVFEFYQAFSDDAAHSLGVAALPATVLSGLVIGASMLGGAVAARYSTSWLQGLGFFGLMAVAVVLQAGVVAALSVSSAVIGIAIVCARNFPMALIHAPVHDAIATLGVCAVLAIALATTLPKVRRALASSDAQPRSAQTSNGCQKTQGKF